ncbi:MAG TPA: hypothetical protein VKY82_06865 [Flavobacterium sp.]|nr:hypothetical protein [Flavobacterium sp.]
MKTYLKFIAFIPLFSLIACDKEDDNTQIQQEDYFNIKVGNTWVYKNYTRQSNQELQVSNILDSVIITDKFSFENKEYFVRETFKKNLDTDHIYLFSKKYININEKGHLALLEDHPLEKNNQKEYVLHPGTDKEFVFENEIIIGDVSYGNVVWRLENNQNINIGENQYVTLPFIGRLQPNEIVDRELVAESHYVINIGLVKEVSPGISGGLVWERHLLSYKN